MLGKQSCSSLRVLFAREAHTFALQQHSQTCFTAAVLFLAKVLPLREISLVFRNALPAQPADETKVMARATEYRCCLDPLKEGEQVKALTFESSKLPGAMLRSFDMSASAIPRK